jgi:hypothetical protein
MVQCALPKEILWDMQMAGVLPFGVMVSGRLDNSTQLVECTPEMAAWCRTEAQRNKDDSERARALLAAAETIEAAGRMGGTFDDKSAG